MSLKIGVIKKRKNGRLTLSTPPETEDALQDYAAIHARETGEEASVADLALVMIQQFLNSDAAFKRARKSLHNSMQSKE